MKNITVASNASKKIIKKYKDGTIVTGYIDDDDDYTIHSFDDEPAVKNKIGTKVWYENDIPHRDNNLPAVIFHDGDVEYLIYENRYWFINGVEYHNISEVYEKFKNNILKNKNVNTNLLKDNGIDAIYFLDYEYIILDQDQYDLAVLIYQNESKNNIIT